MGMFDYINFAGELYQTKDTPCQGLANYEIRGNELWFHDVKYEWIDDPNEHFNGGRLNPISNKWVFLKNFDGVIDFYQYRPEKGIDIEYHSLFNNGIMIKCEKVHEG